MRWFAARFFWLKFVGERSPSKVLKLIALLLSFPCFEASHLFFKITYALNQRRLRRLCGKDLFLKFYNRRIPAGSVVDVFQSLREIERGLNRTEACYQFSRHVASPKSGRLPSALNVLV
jgi:hypothetical protein